MHEELAIKLEHVSKHYRLYGSQREQLCDVLGLSRIGLARPSRAQQFKALEDVSLSVPKGHRIGIIGRNGAGKTTLLKLICGNFTPTSGTVTVNGTVQALMNMGLGFHPEFTGLENVRASLQYNGLSPAEYQHALDDIIAFCELGEFIDQPFKTYSLGMQARLMFAAATAIRPDILIIDEVLGAGDAYFIAKSRQRVEKLVNSGATMLLVSHSTQQVLELCNEAIWMHEGNIRMQGDALVVVKAYEEYIHSKAVFEKWHEENAISAEPQEEPVNASFAKEDEPREFHLGHVHFQEPHFIPHALPHTLPEITPPQELRYMARGGLSRWEGSGELAICGFTIVNEYGESNQLMSMRPAKFVLTLRCALEQNYTCRYAIAVYDSFGKCVLDVVSPPDKFHGKLNATHSAEIFLNPLQLGPGEYTISVSAHEYAPLEVFNATKRYDLLGRSFMMNVDMPDSLRAIETQFYHSAEWRFEENGE